MIQAKVENRVSWYEFKAYQKTLQHILAKSLRNNQKLIAFIGNNYVGKSTCINRLMGVDLYYDEDKAHLVPNPDIIDQHVPCETNHETDKWVQSKPKVIQTELDRLAYIDLPGQLYATKADEQLQMLETTLPQIIKVTNIHSFVVCINYTEISEFAGRNFIATLEKLNQFFPDTILAKKFSFCFTKVGPIEQVAVQKILRWIEPTRFKKMVNVNNIFMVRAISNPSIKPLAQRCLQHSQQPAIAPSVLTLPHEQPHQESKFDKIVTHLRDRLAYLEKDKPDNHPIAAVFDALLHIAQAFHCLVTRMVHAPKIDRLCGTDVKIAIANLITHQMQPGIHPVKFPCYELNEMITAFKNLRDAFDLSFKDHQEQLVYFDTLINGLTNFAASRLDLKSLDIIKNTPPKCETYTNNPHNDTRYFLKRLHYNNSEKIKIECRDFTEVLFSRFIEILSTKNQLRMFSIKGLGFNTNKILSTLSAINAATNELTKIDISLNPCDDNSNDAAALHQLMKRLIFVKPYLQKINVAFTQLGSNFIHALAIVVAGDPALTEINMRGIAPCSDNAGIELLAALFANTRITTCEIDVSSLNVVIAGAIKFIMEHKASHTQEIPVNLMKRLEYFQNKLHTYLNAKPSSIANKSICDVLRRSNFIKLAQKLRVDQLNFAIMLARTSGELNIDVAIKRHREIAPKTHELDEKNKMHFDYLINSGFFKQSPEKITEKHFREALQEYEDFNPIITQAFGISRQEVPKDRNSLFTAIAVQLLQLSENGFPEQLAMHFPAQQRNIDGITIILQKLATASLQEMQTQNATSLHESNLSKLTLYALSKTLNLDIYIMHPDMFNLAVFQKNASIQANDRAVFNVNNALILLHDGLDHYDTITRRPAEDRLQKFVTQRWSPEQSTVNEQSTLQ